MDTGASGSTLEQRFTQLQAQVVAMATAQGGANAVQKGFPETTIFDGGKAKNCAPGLSSCATSWLHNPIFTLTTKCASDLRSTDSRRLSSA